MLTKACILEHERAVKQAVLKQYPVLKATTGFEYGYEIMVGSLHSALKCFEYYVEIHEK
jgi:soluble cytochrome b562